MSAAVVITRAAVRAHALRLTKPLINSRGAMEERRVMIAGLFDERGNVGLGEAAPLPGVSRESLAEVQASLQHALSENGPLIGLRLRRIEDISAVLAPLQLPASARHALDQALLDLLARRRGVSVAWLLHPGARRRVPLHALVSSPEEAQQAVERGAQAIKLKVAVASLEEEAAQIAAVREVLAPAIPIRLDANGGWSEEEAIAAISRFAQFGLQCVEQPVDPRDLTAMARVRAASKVPIAADESLTCYRDLLAIISTGAADALVIKPMIVGGILAAHELAGRAAEAGLPVSITSSLESAIGREGALHVAAASPGTLWTCGLNTGHWLAADLAPSGDDNLVEEIRSRRERRARAEPTDRGGVALLARKRRNAAIARLDGSAA